MKIEQKQARVEDLAGRLEGASAFYLTDFTGLNVQAMTDLRSRLYDAGVEYVVVKNTLARRAVEDMDLPDIEEFFSGPTGLAIGQDDPVAAAKVLDDFADEHEDRPAVKVAVVEQRRVSAEEVGRLAKLPSKEELLAELAGTMEAPMAQLAYSMQSLLTEFAGLVEALRSEQESA